MNRAAAAAAAGTGGKFPANEPGGGEARRRPALSAPSAISATGAAARRYSVLYYKRKKKVHRQKNVSRLDGVLTVSAPPSCLVTLSDADGSCGDGDGDDDESDEDGDDDRLSRGRPKKRKYKEKVAEARRKSDFVYSGIDWSVAKRAFGIEADDDGVAANDRNEFVLGDNGLHEDDIVVLPQLECQIVSVLSSSGGGGVGGGRPTNNLAGKNLKIGIGGGGSSLLRKPAVAGLANGMTRKPPPPLSSRKRPPAPLRSKRAAPPGGITARPGRGLGGLGSRAAPQDPPPRGSKPPPARRAPPPQPERRVRPVEPDSDEYRDSDDDDSGEESDAAVGRDALPPRRPGLPFLLGGKRRRVVCGGGPGRGPGPNPDPDPAAPPAENVFPGAVGALHAPHSVRERLKPHQRTGVAFLWNCLTGSSAGLRRAAEEAGGGGGGAEGGPPPPRGAILADEMGLGKTLMTVTTIFALHRRQRDHRFIVVCPSSLVSNWAKEFDKWIGRASQPKRVVVRRGGEEGLKAMRAFAPVKPNKSEVLIISYELFRMNASILKQAPQIGLLVVDEGHRLKNTAGSQTLSALNSLEHCEARLLITGTPIQNNLSEFYNVANFVCPGILGDLPTFRRVYERPLSAANSKSATREQKARGRSLSRALDSVTSTFMLRRLQRDVLRDELPPRTEALLFCRPSERQRDTYRELTRGAAAAAGGRGPAGAGVSADALTLLTKVRKLCSHPRLLLDGGGAADAAARNDGSDGDDDDVLLSGKLSVLGSLLRAIRERSPDDKVVVVSNFTSALTVIQAALVEREGWGCVRLDGTTEQGARQSLVDSFNRGSAAQSFVFLLSSRAGGCGLNLVGANRLVMFDPDWNPATDMQAMARIYRQGQTKPSFIYRLFTSGTVEEVIYQRQTQKSNLATLTVDGASAKAGGNSAGFTKEELRDCFTLKENTACDTKQKMGKMWGDYDGVDSLRANGCIDEPLLAVVEERSDTLGFVHIETENSDDISRESSSSDNYSGDSEGREPDENHDSTDEEEFEG